jgi:hypothetical protein
MSETYTATPTQYDGATTMVEDGDPIDAAGVRIALEEHSDAVAYEKNQRTSTTTKTRQVWSPHSFDAAESLYSLDHSRDIVRILPTVAGKFSFELTEALPDGCTLTACFCFGHLIGSSRSVEIWLQDNGNIVDAGGDIDELPAVTSLGSSTTLVTSAPWVGKMGYVAVSGMTQVIDRSRHRVFARVACTGSAVDGTDWTACRVAFTPPGTLDKGAA